MGLMGSGKTTVGRELARRSSRPFLDNDEVVRATAGTALEDLLERDGLPGLRAAEFDAFQSVVGTPPPWVGSAAAAAVVDARAPDLIASERVTTVWLRADPATLVQRIGTSRERPHLSGGDPLAVLTAMGEQRSHTYAQLADAVVDVDARSVDQIVEMITAQIAQG